MNNQKKTAAGSKASQQDPLQSVKKRAVAATRRPPVAGTKRQDEGNLGQLFHEHAKRWKTETQHWSSVTRMLAHPSYLRIIGLAKLSVNNEIERLLLHELETEPDYWFDALTAITGEDPVQPHHDFDGSVNAWLEWGRKKGIITH